MRTSEKGFSLLELLIVIAIIAILVAIALPSLLLAKMVANERATVSQLREVSLAEGVYYAKYDEYEDLKVLENGDYMALGVADYTPGAVEAAMDQDAAPDTFFKSGYGFSFTLRATKRRYDIAALPIEYSWTGEEGYWIDQSSVIRFVPEPVNVAQADQDGFAPDWSNVSANCNALGDN